MRLAVDAESGAGGSRLPTSGQFSPQRRGGRSGQAIVLCDCAGAVQTKKDPTMMVESRFPIRPRLGRDRVAPPMGLYRLRRMRPFPSRSQSSETFSLVESVIRKSVCGVVPFS